MRTPRVFLAAGPLGTSKPATRQLLCNIYHRITYPGQYPILNRSMNKYIHGEEGSETGTNWLTLRKGLLKFIIFFSCTNFFSSFPPCFCLLHAQKAGTSPNPDLPPLTPAVPNPHHPGINPTWGMRAARGGS